MFELCASKAFLRRIRSFTLDGSKSRVSYQRSDKWKQHLLSILAAAAALHKGAELSKSGCSGRHNVLFKTWRSLLALCGVLDLEADKAVSDDRVKRASAFFPNAGRPNCPDLTSNLF